MSAAHFDTNEENQKLVMRWTMAGHEVIPDRMLFRHKGMRKTFPPDAILKYSDGTPVISFGKTVAISDILPERADIALDADGRLLNEHDFERRYREYLAWFTYVEGSEIESEPVPGALDFVLATPDVFSESNGFVQINFDARVPAPQERTHFWDDKNDRLVAIEEAQGTTLEAIKLLLEKSTRGPGRPRKEEVED